MYKLELLLRYVAYSFEISYVYFLITGTLLQKKIVIPTHYCETVFQSWLTSRSLGYERMYLPLCEVADTSFYIQREEVFWKRVLCVLLLLNDCRRYCYTVLFSLISQLQPPYLGTRSTIVAWKSRLTLLTDSTLQIKQSCRYSLCDTMIVLLTYRPLGYERWYLPPCKLADTPFHIQGSDMYFWLQDEGFLYFPSKPKNRNCSLTLPFGFAEQYRRGRWKTDIRCIKESIDICTWNYWFCLI